MWPNINPIINSGHNWIGFQPISFCCPSQIGERESERNQPSGQIHRRIISKSETRLPRPQISIVRRGLSEVPFINIPLPILDPSNSLSQRGTKLCSHCLKRTWVWLLGDVIESFSYSLIGLVTFNGGRPFLYIRRDKIMEWQIHFNYHRITHSIIIAIEIRKWIELNPIVFIKLYIVQGGQQRKINL